MKKVTFIRKEIVTDVRWYQAEISTEDFPELLNEDFDIDDHLDLNKPQKQRKKGFRDDDYV